MSIEPKYCNIYFASGYKFLMAKWLFLPFIESHIYGVNLFLKTFLKMTKSNTINELQIAENLIHFI